MPKPTPERNFPRQVVFQESAQETGGNDRRERLAALLSTALSRHLGQDRAAMLNVSVHSVDYAPTLSPTTDDQSTVAREAIL